MFAFIWEVQLALDSLDRLVDMLEERGPLSVVEAARALFATSSIPDGLALSLLDEVTAGDSRVVCTGTTVSLVGGRPDPLLEDAELVVFDLETTGLAAGRDQICEIGAVRVKGLELVDSFQSLVNPRIALPEEIARLTGLREQELRGAPSVSTVVRRFLAFAGDELLVAHNARFDQRFLERQLRDRRLSEPPLCTAALARRLLEGRLRRVGLASLANFFGVPTEPCHRALPDAEATAQVLVHLIGLAQERGARTLSELRNLAAPVKRRVHGKRQLARGAPNHPGVYLFRDKHDQVLYVGRARDLRARLRSYFRSDRQRPSVEAALLALARIEWRVLGSELEAALEELRLIRELAPPANSRGRRKEQGVYLRRRGDELVVSKKPSPLGPIGSRRQASLAARALASCTDAELDDLLQDGPLPRLRARLPLPDRARGRARLAQGLLRVRRSDSHGPLARPRCGRKARDRGRHRALPIGQGTRRGPDRGAGGGPDAPARFHPPSSARAGRPSARRRADRRAPQRQASAPGSVIPERRAVMQ